MGIMVTEAPSLDMTSPARPSYLIFNPLRSHTGRSLGEPPSRFSRIAKEGEDLRHAAGWRDQLSRFENINPDRLVADGIRQFSEIQQGRTACGHVVGELRLEFQQDLPRQHLVGLSCQDNEPNKHRASELFAMGPPPFGWDI